MNRDIKYRIIHKNKIAGYEHLTETGWKWQWIALNPDKGERWSLGVIHDSTPTAMIRNQYTGYKDKKGNEIYEGDLLAEINKKKELKEWGDPLTVEWGEYIDGKDDWGISVATIGFFLRYKDGSATGLNSQDHGTYGFNASEMLIVGNIYENKDLIKANKNEKREKINKGTKKN